MAAFSALRLAKFNLDERQALGFIGLPTPANALFWGSLIVGAGDWMKSAPFIASNLSLVILVGIFISCYLLVAEIPMFALKFKHWGWRGNEVKYVFAVTALFMLLAFSVAGIALVVAWYVLVSLFLMIYERKPAGADK
jgi:CDP-diacylglycerol--serine O-phosphatidyltransferase